MPAKVFVLHSGAPEDLELYALQALMTQLRSFSQHLTLGAEPLPGDVPLEAHLAQIAAANTALALLSLALNVHDAILAALQQRRAAGMSPHPRAAAPLHRRRPPRALPTQALPRDAAPAGHRAPGEAHAAIVSVLLATLPASMAPALAPPHAVTEHETFRRT